MIRFLIFAKRWSKLNLCKKFESFPGFNRDLYGSINSFYGFHLGGRVTLLGLFILPAFGRSWKGGGGGKRAKPLPTTSP